MKSFFSAFRLMLFVIVVLGTVFWTCSEEPTKPPPPVVDEPKDTTTTSNFTTYFYDTLGVAYSGFGSVAIINDTDAWVGGVMCLRDSTGKVDCSIKYNAAHWTGKSWELVCIPFSVTMIDGSLYRTDRVIPESVR